MTVLAVFGLLATEARELTSMYGGFWTWIGLLVPVGAVGGVVLAVPTYLGLRLARTRRNVRAIVGPVFLASIVTSLGGGLIGALEHEPARQRQEAERQQGRDCERAGGSYDAKDDSCSF